MAEAEGRSLLGRSVITGRAGVTLLGNMWSHGERVGFTSQSLLK